MKFTQPAASQTFTITSAPEWPAIEFETDAAGPHTWSWSLAWGAFKKSGKATTPGNTWDAKAAVADGGGTLTVRAEAQQANATIAVSIKGTNPSAAEVGAYLAKQPGADGFDKIVAHESKFKHFNAVNEPIKSFDNGYGMCQLTTPTPTFEQVWNWKSNIDGGLKLFAQKVASATTYLGQAKRSHTPEQLKYEAVCRWNGGAYHEWDAKAAQWVRPASMLCDTKTGNIGWNMNDEKNKGKTEAELRKRDSGSYSKPPTADAHWKYSGICYADRILG